MPREKEDPPSATVVKIRMPIKIKIECLKAKEDGLHWHEAESTFLGYLLELGLRKYQKVILPAETSNDESSKPTEKKVFLRPTEGIAQKTSKKKVKEA